MITIKELVKLKSKKLIDVREQTEYTSGHIPNAKNIPLMGLMFNTKNFLNKEDEYYIVCESGGRSQQAVTLLKKKGYAVKNVDGGMCEYRLQNYKIEF